MGKVFITGGLGYIGYELVKGLTQSDDHEIVIYDNLYRKNLAILFRKALKNKRVKFIEGDILDERLLSKSMKGADSVVHLAAKVTNPYGQGDFHMFDYINNWGTANVVNAIKENNIKEVIYLSTTSIYGHSDGILGIESLIQPSGDYAISKYNGEKHIDLLKGHCKLIKVRSGNTYGFNPSLRLDTVVNNFVYKAKFNQTLIIHGDGEEYRSFVSIDRLGKQLKSLVLDSNYNENVYLICEHNVKVLELIEIIKEIVPNLQFRHVNPSRKMTNQQFEPSVIPGFKIKTTKDFQEDILDFYNKFSL